MNYIIHCSTCRSRSEFDTDWNGHLVERLNYPCTCPPLAFENLRMDGTCMDCGAACFIAALRCVPCGAAVQVTPRAPRFCSDCGCEVAGKKVRCEECFKVHNRARALERHYRKKAA